MLHHITYATTFNAVNIKPQEGVPGTVASELVVTLLIARVQDDVEPD